MVSSSQMYEDAVSATVACANAVYEEFVHSEEGFGFRGEVRGSVRHATVLIYRFIFSILFSIKDRGKIKNLCDGFFLDFPKVRTFSFGIFRITTTRDFVAWREVLTISASPK